LFGSKTDNTETIDQVFEVLKELVQNGGKRKALFRKYNEDNSIDIDTELKGAILLEDFKRQIKSEIMKEAKKEAQKQIKKELESAKSEMIKSVKNELLKDLINK
jgi:excinuclease UvrABC helicase subunit UvrB